MWHSSLNYAAGAIVKRCKSISMVLFAILSELEQEQFIRIRAGAVVRKDEQVEGLGGMVEVEVATGQHQMRSERRVCLVLVHQDCHVADEQQAALKKAAAVSGGKDECQVRLKGKEHDYWMGTEIGMLEGYGFQGQVTAGDGSDKQGKMGAGYNNLRRKKKKRQCKVRREAEGSSSNWSQLAVFLLALRNTLEFARENHGEAGSSKQCNDQRNDQTA